MLYLTKSQIVALGAFESLMNGAMITSSSRLISIGSALVLEKVFSELSPRLKALHIEPGQIERIPNKTTKGVDDLEVDVTLKLVMHKKWQNACVVIHLSSAELQDCGNSDTTEPRFWVVTEISLKARLIGEGEYFYTEPSSGVEMIPHSHIPDIVIKYEIN